MASTLSPAEPIGTQSGTAPRGAGFAGQPWKLGLILAGVTWCLYGSTLSHPFLFDDWPNIRENPSLHDWAGIGRILQTHSRPVAMLTFAANYAISGNRVWSYHVVNILVHAAAAVTLFGLVRRTLLLPTVTPREHKPEAQAKENDTKSWATMLALAVALLWAVHPLQTQAVTYIVQRMESLMGLFFLLCLYLVVRGIQSSRRLHWFSVAILCCWLGMGCKEVMAACPLVLLVYDRTFLARSWGALVRERWWLHAGTFSSLLWLGWLIHIGTASQPELSAGFGTPNMTSWEYLRSQGGVILHYLRLIVWPDALCLDYGWPKATSPLAIYLPCGIVLALLLTALGAFWKRPALGFLGVSFFLILAPTSSIMPIADLAFEHRMYLPLACVITFLVFAADELSHRLKLPPQKLALLRGSLLVLPVVLLGARTMLRNRDYASDVGMWKLVAQQRPENARAYRNLAWLYRIEGQREAAIENYNEALRLDPTGVATFVELGNLYYGEKDYVRAMPYYQRATEIRPDQYSAWLNVALVQMKTGHPREALQTCEKARRLQPNSRLERKIRAWIMATADDPKLRNGQAAIDLLKTLKPLPGKIEVDLLDRFAAAYAEAGDFAKAVATQKQAIAAATSQKVPKVFLSELTARLSLYQAGRPYRLSAGVSDAPASTSAFTATTTN